MRNGTRKATVLRPDPVVRFARPRLRSLVGALALTAALVYLGAAGPDARGQQGQQPLVPIPAPTPLPNGTGAPKRPAIPLPELPPPGQIEPFGPGQIRLPRLDSPALPLGTTPHPSPEKQAEYNKYVRELKDPESTLDLIMTRTRLMVLHQAPIRVQVSDPRIASAAVIAPTEISLVGKAVGSTVMTLWFVDPQTRAEKLLTYLIRVLPDPEARQRLERIYKRLQEEINGAFPDDLVVLSLVGDKLVVSGQAKDIAEATQILRIIRANAPPLDTARIPVDRVNTASVNQVGPDGLPPRGIDDFLTAGGPNVVNLLRIPGEQQVMLKVTVAEVNRAAARSIGLNFSTFNSAGALVLASTTGGLTTAAGAASGTNFLSPQFTFNNGTGTGLANIPVALNNGNTRLAINALRSLSYAKALAEPNLVTMNGQTATFSAGGEFPIPVISGLSALGGLTQGVTFMPFGVQLTFTPFITDRDRIRLNVLANVSSKDQAAGSSLINGSAIPNLTTRNFQTTVELREGETLAVAGLIQTNLGASSQRVPLIGDLPIIGRLASFDQISAGEQELVVLITPELVHPMANKEVGPLPGSDIFEPGDIEFYLLGRIESHRPYDYRSPVMTDFARMKQYRQLERSYLCGPAGHTPLQ